MSAMLVTRSTVTRRRSGCRNKRRRRTAAGFSFFRLRPQTYGIDREQTCLDAGKQKRNNPACQNEKPPCHEVPFLSAELTQVVFSKSISSMRLRPVRRTVMASRGISSCAPEAGR